MKRLLLLACSLALAAPAAAQTIDTSPVQQELDNARKALDAAQSALKGLVVTPAPTPTPTPTPEPTPTPTPELPPEPTMPAPPPPTPDPAPAFQPGNYTELSPSLDGLPLQVAHNYQQDLQKSWGSGAIPPDNGTDPLGAYRQICGTAGLGMFDVVLYPNQPGKGHMHDIVGKRGAGAYTTAQTLISPGTSTCNDNALGTASQNSLYWQPALFDGQGNVIRIDYGSGYYKRVPKSHPDCQHPTLGNICIPVPNGLKLFVGRYPDGTLAPFTKGSTAPGINQIQWKCVGTGAVGTPQPDLESLLAISPICPQLDQVIAFPACWDGKHLWLPKAAHMAWQVRNVTTGKSACPATHPYKLPAITFQYFRTTDANWAKGTYCLSSDMKGPRCDQNPTVKRGSTNHGDALIVWDQRVRDRMEAGCINGHKNCSGGDLGDGGQLIGASVPYYTDATGKRAAKWTNPVRLTPIDSVSTTQQTQMH